MRWPEVGDYFSERGRCYFLRLIFYIGGYVFRVIHLHIAETESWEFFRCLRIIHLNDLLYEARCGDSSRTNWFLKNKNLVILLSPTT